MKNKVILLIVLLLGLVLRLIGNNWDQGWHLHPDERFLTMVGVNVKIPYTVSEYLDQHTSTFNPANRGNPFFVYGTLPILINKGLAQYLSNDTYEQFNLQGRVLSGTADFFIILIVYGLVGMIEKKLKMHKSIKYLAAFFYAIAVLPIQLSHFFTVDTFLNLFCWMSLYFAVALAVHNKHGFFLNIILSGFFMGLAIASKVSAVYFAPLVGIYVVFGLVSYTASLGPSSHKRTLLFPFLGITFFVTICYLALRLGAPYYFETNNIFNPQLSVVFVNSISTLKSFENPNSLFPPGVQWLSKTIDFPIRNIIFFGVGPAYFIFSLIGMYILLKRKNIYIFSTVLWLMLFLIYESFQFAKTMRYLIFIYPFLAFFAAVGLFHIVNRIKKISNKYINLFISLFIYLIIIIWPLAFMSIYTKDHSRVTASKWIYENIPKNSRITYEYWDDPLPLMVQDPSSRNYQGIEVHIFDPDTDVKWNTINKQLENANYYIMSSNRGWGSILSAPKYYPVASSFYKEMFDGKRNFTKVKEITSYPSLRYLGIPMDFPDQWAEEAFTVYDHPEVMIFKKR